MAAKRIYEVKNKETGVCRLVRASSRAQAVGHVARNSFDVEVASQDTLVNVVGMGVKVEDVAAE
jgi:hypothetical protein